MPQNALLLVQRGLCSVVFMAQSYVADRSELFEEPLYRLERDSQREKLRLVANAIRAPFESISEEDVVVALEHCCIAGEGFQIDYYNDFLAKLRAEGEAGIEMANAFETLKRPNA